MHLKRLFTLIICLLFFGSVQAQINETADEVDYHSYTLYNAGKWKELLTYGKEKNSSGIDFSILRMRMGYAAFALGDYSQSLKQYQAVLKDEPDNSIALYYVYLNNLELNNITATRFYAAKLPLETKEYERISKVKLHSIEAEYSYKIPSEASRGNAQYSRIGINMQLGYRLQLQQSGALFKQIINEPNFIYVTDNQKIDLNLKEYYGKLIFAITGKLSAIGGFHYLKTPFNNYTYNNTVIFSGIKYTTPYIHLKAMTNFGKITDKTFNQYDVTVNYYPFGNLKLYSISRVAYGDKFVFSQIAGYGITRKMWMEANVTLGTYYNYFENDALYVFNDIDKKQFKAGGSLYATLSKNVLATFNYTFEQKLKYQTTNNYFYQNSINGVLTWKF